MIEKINRLAPLSVNGLGGAPIQVTGGGGKKISQWAPLPENGWAGRKNKSIGSATSKWLVKKFN